MSTTIKEQIRDYIEEYLMLYSDDELNDETSLLDANIVDSLGVTELAEFIQKTFGVIVPDKEITPENFDSIKNLENYVRLKLDLEICV